MEQKTTVVIVGAGPAGLATSACLNQKNIPNIVLEREDCAASLWRKRAYDRLKLHLAKEFCELPHMPFPPNAPTFVPKNVFVEYLDEYSSRFQISPLYHCIVVSATFDQGEDNWVIVAQDARSGTTEKWVAKFLVVATGENSEGSIPSILGLDSYKGEVLHSNGYDNGERFKEREVLVVGSGNSGMEIAFDLSNWGARTSIVIRSPVHILSENMVRLGMKLLAYLPVNVVDNLVIMLADMKHGNLSSYGIQRPKMGPFFLKKETGRSAVIDVGTVGKIRAGEIKVFPSIEMINGNQVEFSNGRSGNFDAIVFSTGYSSTVRRWLKDDGGLFGEDGMPMKKAKHHWKGENGLYCAGFARSGLFGISKDAKAIAQDINSILN
ncbi:Flavin-binding monooxygenase family protein [Perilla frutescens var. frutescens]|nr:Flavin-binding monooxygenase family protein [Perilla frutescens var. frutescens]